MAPADLIGPVARQHYRKTSPGSTFTQENHFFLVRVERFDSGYWQQRWIGARRVF